MRTNLLLSLILVSFFVALTSSASSFNAAAPWTGAFPICGTDATGDISHNPEVNRIPTNPGGTITAFESINYFYDAAIKDHVEIRYVISSTAITLTSLARDLTTQIVRTITLEAGELFHSWRGKVVITKRTTPVTNVIAFKAYWFDSANTAGALNAGASIDLTGVDTTPFTPVALRLISYDDRTVGLVNLIIYLDGATAKGLYQVVINSNTMVGAPPSVAIAKGALAAFPAIGDALGSQFLFINKADGLCYKSNQGAPPAFAADTSCDIVAPATWTIDIFFLTYSQISVIANSKAGSPGKVAYTAANGAPSIFNLANGVHRAYSDKLRNVLIVGSSIALSLFWISGTDTGAPIRSQVPQMVGTHDDFISAAGITFANHRVFLLKATGFSIYYQDATTQDIQKMKSLTGNYAPLLATTGQSEYDLTMKCSVSTISLKRFTCFATTLNCITTAKGTLTVITAIEAPGGITN